MKPVEEAQWTFLHDQILGSAITASTQRAGVYAPEGEGDRREFKNGLRKKLTELGDAYEGEEINETIHIKNIVELADQMSDEHGSCLHGGQYRIGVAQKALNLHLKYLWCMGKIPIPPHCPLDRWIISFLPAVPQVNWTQLDNISTYAELINGLKIVAGEMSLSEWELRVWQSDG